LRSLQHSESVPVEWEEVQMLGPDVDDRHTLGQLARMTGNAYALPGQKNWYDIDEAWNTVGAAFDSASQRMLIVSLYSRASPSAGKTRLTASEGMSSYHRRMQQSSSVLKAQRYKDRPQRRTNSTIICCFLAVVPMSIFRGYSAQYATAIARSFGATIRVSVKLLCRIVCSTILEW
jgi:hypothetical protein